MQQSLIDSCEHLKSIADDILGELKPTAHYCGLRRTEDQSVPTIRELKEAYQKAKEAIGESHGLDKYTPKEFADKVSSASKEVTRFLNILAST